MIIIMLTITVLFLLALPVLAAIGLRRRAWSSWLLFLMGVATFVGSQAVHIPLNNWLADIGLLPQAGSFEGPPLWRTALLLGLTAGLCEELARAAGLALLRRRLPLQDALMLGLGHGGIEAMFIGGVALGASMVTLLSLRFVDLGSLGLDANIMAQIAEQMINVEQPYSTLALATVERCIAMGLHLTFSVMVWRAFERRTVGWLLLAIAYHAAVDMVAVYAGQVVSSRWLMELAFLVVTLPGLFWLWRQRGDLPRPDQARRSPTLRDQWPAVVASVRKELLQIVRTKHLLIAMALFLFVGISSPLLAYFTPLIFASIEEVKPFADLIPEPSTADAMVQYVKNLTQFLLPGVVLLGMGAVAAEKERGTAAMALSKPVPRWAFVLAKMATQTMLLTAGLVAAALCAYLYTLVLFEPMPVGPFALVNLLLWTWLLVFAAATLLGSTLGKSAGAAAGIAVGLSGALLLASYIPKIGAFAPSGLLAWASAIGPGFEGVAPLIEGMPFTNASALGTAAILIVLALIAAVGALEAQEI